jgi:hypothetical protein
MFLGREREELVVREFVTGLAQRGGALVVIGDPGTGKSTDLPELRLDGRAEKEQ